MAQTPRSQCKGPGSIPGEGTISCMLYLRVHRLQLRASEVKFLRELEGGVGGTYLHLPFDKTGNVILIIKDRQGVEEILLQPVPVLVYFL